MTVILNMLRCFFESLAVCAFVHVVRHAGMCDSLCVCICLCAFLSLWCLAVQTLIEVIVV